MLEIVKNFIAKLKNQAIYQGQGKKRKNYFEGWYFKLVSSINESYAIIPGVSFDDQGDGYAFIQFFDGVNNITEFFKFSIEEFSYEEKSFKIEIGKNIFSDQYLQLNLHGENFQVSGKIEFDELIPWPSSIREPGIMGWYRYVPKMECYHGAVGFDHLLSGNLEINGSKVDFLNGKGYIEKDYGTSFPSYYIWMQTNHFEIDNTSLMVSFARIPWLRGSFDGFVAGFLYGDELLKFTTYNGSSVSKLRINDKEISIHLHSKYYILEVTANKFNPIELNSPELGAMSGRILESLQSEIHVRLLNKKNGDLIFEGIGINAGVDIGGEVSRIPVI